MPRRVSILQDPDIKPDENDMRFRLTYEGRLLGASKSDTRAKHKHQIRKVFHKQLKTLWTQTPAFSNAKTKNSNGQEVAYLGALSEEFSRNGFHFAPLATEDLGASCGLDILFLRPDPPGSLIKSGDIDNRLKTLFDALRMPTGSQELGGFTAPEDGEDPFFVLLQDDRLISQLSLETDMLLQPSGKEGDVNDCRLVITVTLRPISPSARNADLF